MTVTVFVWWLVSVTVYPSGEMLRNYVESFPNREACISKLQGLDHDKFQCQEMQSFRIGPAPSQPGPEVRT